MTYYSPQQQVRLLPQLVPANPQEFLSPYDFRQEEDEDDFDYSQQHQGHFNQTNFSQDYLHRRHSSASSVASTVSSHSSQDSFTVGRDFLTKKLHQNLVEKKLPDLKEFDDSLTNLNWLQTMNPMKLENSKSQDSNSSYSQQNFSTQNSIMDPEERLDYRTCAHIKPPYSYASLICMAMRDLGRGKITLSDIYSWITENFMYYRMADSSWQNSVRHNLSLNKCFEKVPRRKDEPGKGGFWRINPKYADVLENGLNKRRRALPQLVSSHCPSHTKQNCHSRLFPLEKQQRDAYSSPLPPTSHTNSCSNTSNSGPMKRARCSPAPGSNYSPSLAPTATGMLLTAAPQRRRALPNKIPSIVRPEYRTAESSDKVDTQMRYMGGPIASSLQQFNCSLNQESFMDSSIMLSCGNTLAEEDFTDFLECCSPVGQVDSSSSSGVGEVCSDIGSDELDLNQMKDEPVVCESTESCEVMWDDLNSMLGLN